MRNHRDPYILVPLSAGPGDHMQARAFRTRGNLSAEDVLNRMLIEVLVYCHESIVDQSGHITNACLGHCLPPEHQFHGSERKACSFAIQFKFKVLA